MQNDRKLGVVHNLGGDPGDGLVRVGRRSRAQLIRALEFAR
jgi:hypothetical protein